MIFKCPLCGSPLSAQHYHRVLRLQERKNQSQERKLRDALARLKAAKTEGVNSERKRSAAREKLWAQRYKKLQEAYRMRQQRTSPQEMGLADEAVLVKRLQDEFPEDEIVHVGQGGDVLHYVSSGRKKAGCIVYECKRVPKILPGHIKQAALARKTREAHYGILVTTGTRKGFSGLEQDKGVLVVAPSGAITLAHLCRESLVTMAKQELDAFARVAAAKRLVDFITGPSCKASLEDAIAQTEQARARLLKEMKTHANDWRARNEIYQTISCDISHIQKNIGRVLANQEPVRLERPKPQALVLPAKS